MITNEDIKSFMYDEIESLKKELEKPLTDKGKAILENRLKKLESKVQEL